MEWTKLKKYLQPGNLVLIGNSELGIILPDLDEDGRIRICGDGLSSRAWYTEKGLREITGSIEKIWGPAPNRYGVSFDTEHRQLLYPPKEEVEVDVKDNIVFIGVSNLAGDGDVEKVTKTIKQEGKQIQFWDSNLSAYVNQSNLAKCSELVIVPPKNFSNGDFVGEGIVGMIQTALNAEMRIRVLVNNKLRKYNNTKIMYNETESYVNYAKLYVW